jgi:large subunit ribosomal protein L35
LPFPNGNVITHAAGCSGLKGHAEFTPKLFVKPIDKWKKQMPKIKTKSGVKKRFRLTASGKVRANQAGKQHGMIKRTNKQIRNQRGTTILAPQDAKIIKKFMPNG